MGAGWIHEIKFDGYRIQTRVLDDDATLKIHKGLDWTAKYPEIAEAAFALPDCIVDGEICTLDENGAPDFAALQAALSEGKTDNLVDFAFDLLYGGGEDVRSQPLVERKARLQVLLADAGNDPRIRFVEHFETGGDEFRPTRPPRSPFGLPSHRTAAAPMSWVVIQRFSSLSM